MLQFIVYVLLLIYFVGAIAAVFTFVIDVFKWHKREEHVNIIPSADLIESEVINIERRDNGRAPGGGDNDNYNNNGNSDGNGDNDNNNNFF